MRLLATFLCLLTLIIPAAAQAANIETSAKQAVMIDHETGMVLYEKNAHEKMPTSSMSKVMTAYMVFDALKEGQINMDTRYLVSEKAWRKGGSKMFVEVDKRVKVEDLLRGVIIQSGNDATIVLAEGLSGTESAFAAAMTQKAESIGMNNTNFTNASGWPDENHYSTAYDLAIMARSLIENFPEYYKIYSEQEFTYNNITQRNRNPLLYRNIGADGVKTGHTEAGGYGLIGSGTHNDRRVIFVVNGLEDERARAQEGAKLLEWGLRSFTNKTLFKSGDKVSEASIVMGKQKTVPLTVREDVRVTLPLLASKSLKAAIEYNAPLIAPIEEGKEIGKLVITIPNRNGGPLEYPVYAAKTVPELGLFSKTLAKAKLLLKKSATN